MKKKIAGILKLLPVLIADAAMVVLEARSLWNIWKGTGRRMFIYYTQDSNILAMIICAVSVIATVLCLLWGKERPGWIRRIKHIAASCLAVTFIVELFVLIPMACRNTSDLPRQLRIGMLDGEMLYMHTLCPLLMIFSFLFLEPGGKMRSNVYIALIPTMIYGGVSLYMNYIHAYIGPYPFLHIYIQPVFMTVVWMIVIMGGAEMIALGLYALNRLITRLYEKVGA